MKRYIALVGEYRPCKSCRLRYQSVYPLGTTYGVVYQWWGETNVFPHKQDCPRGYMHKEQQQEAGQ